MAIGKLFYYMKLYKAFFESAEFGFLMSLPKPGLYVIFYLQLVALSMNTGGELQCKIGKIKVPFNKEKIRQECKYYTAEEVSEGLQILEDLGLIICQKNGVYKIVDFGKLVGSETDYAAQKREQRSKKSAKPDVDTQSDFKEDTSADKSVDNVHIEFRVKSLEYRDIDIKSLYTSFSGGDGAPASASTLRNYFLDRGYLTSDYYGVTDDFAERVANITCLIFKAFVGRQPVQADVVAVATSISNDAVDESHEREIAKEKLDLLLYAFEQACNAGNPGSWNYVNGVLGRLAQRGIRTLADAEQYDADR